MYIIRLDLDAEIGHILLVVLVPYTKFDTLFSPPRISGDLAVVNLNFLGKIVIINLKIKSHMFLALPGVRYLAITINLKLICLHRIQTPMWNALLDTYSPFNLYFRLTMWSSLCGVLRRSKGTGPTVKMRHPVTRSALRHLGRFISDHVS